MKNFELSEHDDITALPSDELNSKTIAAMRAKEEEMKESRKHIRVKKIVTIAAAACLALFLMGMGVRVFEYLTYVPGMGIVTAQQEEVYTLKSVVEAGGYRIEAMSLIPVTKGENKGMWEVTVLTNEELPKDFFENPDRVNPMIFTDRDGEGYSLRCSGGSGIGVRYEGYVKADGEGDYTVSWLDGEHTVTLQSMENTVWANYAYPMDQGLTVITFPLAENSQFMVFDVVFDPESENLMYWAEHSDAISFQPHGITIYDVNGNQYSVPSRSGHGIPIPESEKANGINNLLSYKIETIMTLDRALEAPIERVELYGITIDYMDISGTGFYKTTVPELDQVVEREDLPDDGVLFDDHGIMLQLLRTTSIADDRNNTYDFVMHSRFPVLSFEENIVGATVMPKYVNAENIGVVDPWDHRMGSSEGMIDEEYPENGYMVYAKDINGYGDRKIKNGNIGVTFGDEIAVSVGELWLIIEGNWIIDFSETAGTAE